MAITILHEYKRREHHRGKLVLVVDDNRDLRKIMSTTLHNAGYEVALARSGEAGIPMAVELRHA